jgi:hypothetical protein
MAKFRKLPVEITAITFAEFVAYAQQHSAPPHWYIEYNGHPITHHTDDCYFIPTLEGVYNFTPQDMLITGVNGEIYPCKVDIFEKTYQEVETDTSAKITYINDVIQSLLKGETNEVSDGYHTFRELYEHRIMLYIALCKMRSNFVWRSKVQSDGTSYAGWFLLGMGVDAGHQITYHLPIIKWDACHFAQTLDRAPDYDGHTSQNVLTRLERLLKD